MRKLLFVMLVASVLTAGSAKALDFMHDHIPEVKVVGEGQLSFAFWDIYIAKLFAPQGKWDGNKPYALSIHYLRDIDKDDIAARTIEEMRLQGFTDEMMLAAWFTQLKTILPDVSNGTMLTAVFLPEEGTKFFEQDRLLGLVRGQEFARRFSDIWLGEKTSEPELRRKLLGLS